jgi:uncharacterized protein YbbC (DUF1343 family)
MLPGLDALELDVVPVSGWVADSLWSSYGTEWIATSPNIPDFETALVYPGAGLFEGTSWSEGRGTRTPFRHVGSPWVGGAAMASLLNEAGLSGVRFEPASFTPESIPSMSASPKHEGVALEGVSLIITDAEVFYPVAAGVHLVAAAYRLTPDDMKPEFFRSRWMRLISGGSRLEDMITTGDDPEEIVDAWSDEVARFVEMRRRYLLY